MSALCPILSADGTNATINVLLLAMSMFAVLPSLRGKCPETRFWLTRGDSGCLLSRGKRRDFLSELDLLGYNAWRTRWRRRGIIRNAPFGLSPNNVCYSRIVRFASIPNNIQTCPAITHPLHQLQFVHFSFDHSIAGRQCQPRFHSLFVSFHTCYKTLQLADLAVPHFLKSGVELFPSTGAQHLSELLD